MCFKVLESIQQVFVHNFVSDIVYKVITFLFTFIYGYGGEK